MFRSSLKEDFGEVMREECVRTRRIISSARSQEQLRWRRVTVKVTIEEFMR